MKTKTNSLKTFGFEAREEALSSLASGVKKAQTKYRHTRRLTKIATWFTGKAIQYGYQADALAAKALKEFYSAAADTTVVDAAPVPAAPAIPSISTNDAWTKWFKLVDEEIQEEIAARKAASENEA